MDMKRMRRQSQPLSDPVKEEGLIPLAGSGKKPGSQISVPAFVLVAFLIILTLFVLASGARRSHSLITITGLGGGGGGGGTEGRSDFILRSRNGRENIYPKQSNPEKDRLLGGLLSPEFNDQSCLSRYRTVFYRRNISYRPSPYLIQKLRTQESLQKKCGPGTDSYKKAVERLKSGQQTNFGRDCNYLVWISYSGLGNRILTLASAFLYSLLTNRVLLVDRGKDMDDLFCEPFPETSWLLPLDFPLYPQFSNFTIDSPESYGNMVKNQAVASTDASGSVPDFLLLNLDHGYNENDKLFFCEEDQRVIQRSQWLILRSDNYFVPGLFLYPHFEPELNRMFPERESVFHLLGLYLFHPTNQVWGLVTRYYDSYLSKADERVGIQVRVFDPEPDPFQHVMDQILSCSVKQNLLPETVSPETTIPVITSPKSKSVLMTSLSRDYYEKIRNMYWENPTGTGETVSVYQPSYEGYQQSEKKNHNRKAWAEMYLLSLTDKLITSGWSTFGYVAQGLGGLKPWILVKPENRTVPDPPCIRAYSIEPCFHAPPFYDCKSKRGADTGSMVPHVRHCEDISWGLKLVDWSE